MQPAGNAFWSDAIAIVGISACFPGTPNLEKFWRALEAGECLISTFSDEDVTAAGVGEAWLKRRDFVRRGTIFEGGDSFDAKFFGVNRREAEITDPQHRVFLETAWHALEDAGYTGEDAEIGVFAGVSLNSYYLSHLIPRPELLLSVGGYQLMLGNEKDFLATRVAYKLNLRGPAIVVQTACSTSLAAVHLACQSILRDECEMALAGGVSISFPQGTGYLYVPGMIMSPDGYCRPFDKEANGTVPGQGVAVVVLKKLSTALRDEDSIYAVIRGSAWNNDGAGKVGYTAPGIDGQAAVIRQAQQVAGVSANRISYIETHGTGTELGDSIEVAALAEVFAGDRLTPCMLGAVKANLGHTDVVAGVAGLIKAALAIQRGVIPPTPNFREPKSTLGLERGPFVVSSSAMSWPVGEERWAGVSSFGIGGTNVHVVLTSAPERNGSVDFSVKEDHLRLIPVSARTQSALETCRLRLADHLAANPATDFASVASTLQSGRRAFEYRFATVAGNTTELITKLREPLSKRPAEPIIHPEIVFLFPGQGQQFIGMAARLYRADRSFRELVDDGAQLIRDEFGIEVLSILAGHGQAGELKETMKETSVAQPLLFLLEYALATRWRRLGAEPVALLGHSLGELTAATVAGVFSFEDGLRLSAERGRLMGQSSPGVMLAVLLAPEELARYFVSDVWMAAENAPKLSVASGLPGAIEELERKLAEDRVASVRLVSKNAFHCPLMAEAAKAFRDKVAAVPRKAPAIPWLSNVSGNWIDSDEAQSPQYWANQIVSRVRFSKCVATLGESRRLLMEVGPGEALIGMVRQQTPKSVGLPSLGSENRRKGDDLIFLETAAGLWKAGIDLVWSELHPAEKVRRIPLPGYPFERERYYIQPPPKTSQARPGDAAGPADQTVPETLQQPGKRADISSWFYIPAWQSTPPASLVSTRNTAKTAAPWLVLIDSSGLGEAVANRLQMQGAAVVTVSIATDFVRDGTRFSINPKRRNDYERLWREVAALGLRPTGLLCFWTVRAMPVPAFDCLVMLLQSKRSNRLDSIEIISDRLQQIVDEPVQNVENAEALGLMRAIGTEFPGTQCRAIDIDLAAGNRETIVEQIVSEVALPGDGQAIACRGMTRWRKEWTPAPLQKSSSLAFRKGGTYLITGGVGGIGYVLAHHLLKEYAAQVVLTGRTELPARQDWRSWLESHPAEDGISLRLRRIEQLEQVGGHVRFVTADAASREAMAAVISAMRQANGKIDGVVHAAGLPGGRMISGLDPDEATEIRRPKVQGSLVLAELLRGSDLDFFLLCSSVSAIAPGIGQAAYAAANEFLNYFAGYCRSAYGLPAVAVDFDAWRDVGMAAAMVLPEGLDDLKEARLSTAMSPEEGIEVVERVLRGWRGPQILVSTVGWAAPSRPKRTEASSAIAKVDAQDEPIAQVSAVMNIWSELLAATDITPQDNFFELGGHSLLGTMVLSRIQEHFGVVLSLKTLFEAPTPEALAERIRLSLAQESITVPAVLETEREEFEF
jgi:acyl transferase domain-containing protein